MSTMALEVRDIALIPPKISILPFRIVTIIAFIIAMTAVICRLLALGSQRKKVQLDDIFLTFATICLIAATVVLFIFLPTLYFIESVSLNGVEALFAEHFTGNLVDTVSYYLQMNWVYVSLSWACIFLVKFSFLSFFSGLCDRQPRLELYRKGVYVFCLLVGIFEIVSSFTTCPHLGVEALQCSGPAVMKTSLQMGIASTTLDIVTDIAILMIPMSLLWRVKLRTYQKLVIGTFLCLSIVMLLLAVVRISGMLYYGTIDYSWTCLWYQTEASAAVTMISLTAFRSAFLPNTYKNSNHRPWEASMPRFVKRWGRSSMSSNEMNLDAVYVPSATMTGMRTVIGRGDEGSSVSVPDQIGIASTFSQTIQDYHIPDHHYEKVGQC